MIDFDKPTVFTNYEDMKKEVKVFLTRETPSILNMGELSDGLAYDYMTEITKWIVPLFGEQSRHKLLILTKSVNIDNLLNLDHNDQTIFSMSINAQKVGRIFEGKSPKPYDRVLALKQVKDEGYPVRIRIDPMLPINGWQDNYIRLLRYIKRKGADPERFTIGSLRYFNGVKKFSNYWDRGDDVWKFASVKDGSDGRYRLSPQIRMQMYSFIAEKIRAMFPDAGVGICKETSSMRKSLGFTDEDTVCNCTF